MLQRRKSKSKLAFRWHLSALTCIYSMRDSTNESILETKRRMKTRVKRLKQYLIYSILDWKLITSFSVFYIYSANAISVILNDAIHLRRIDCYTLLILTAFVGTFQLDLYYNCVNWEHCRARIDYEFTVHVYEKWYDSMIFHEWDEENSPESTYFRICRFGF